MYCIIDTHVHLYHCYNPLALFTHAANNLDRLTASLSLPTKPVTRVLCLTERYDCNFFEEFFSGAGADNNQTRDRWGYSIERTVDDSVLKLTLPDGRSTYLVAGHQIVTSERIEVLALACREKITDGQPLQETLAALQKLDAVPVLCWAPGKWFFKRGKLVGAALQMASPGSLACGDTTLRPPIWPEPRLMRGARARGIAVVAGSDPLPFAGEEQQCGRYASLVELERADLSFVSRIRLALRTGRYLQSLGSRSSTFQVWRRLQQNRVVR